MSIKHIITVPDETLKKISDPVEKVGVNEKKFNYSQKKFRKIRTRV